jgi:Cof subfamily protein (haloacid dehalogenase superfamily)
MKYKSILLDVDGTLVPVGPHTTPSEKVIKSIERAKGLAHVSIVSGRSLEWLTNIFQSLDLTAPSIINGGSQIIDPKTHKVLWERHIHKEDVGKILKIINRDKIPFVVNDNGIEYENPSKSEFTSPLAIKLSYFDSKKKSDRCLETLATIPDISAHKTFSWNKERVYVMDIYITHKEATKQHAAEKLAQILNIETSEIIGVGDARNDAPLLNACGLKVAMGNADNKLKKMAHYIAPTVEQDGVAYVIEKFILL